MGKRRFAGTVRGFNQTTDASRYSSEGVSAHVRGWDTGVKVEAFVAPDGQDAFQIFTTGGSHNANSYKHIGTIRLNKYNKLKFYRTK
jgi:hypothetical protein